MAAPNIVLLILIFILNTCKHDICRELLSLQAYTTIPNSVIEVNFKKYSTDVENTTLRSAIQQKRQLALHIDSYCFLNNNFTVLCIKEP